MKAQNGPLISEDSKAALKKELDSLTGSVRILLFTSKNTNRPFNEFTIKLFTELALLSDKVMPQFEIIGEELSRKYDITRSPSVLIEPDKFNIRLTGAPAGEEFQTFLLTLIMASTGTTILSDASKERLAALKDPRAIKVFVSPTCPYCPLQAAFAIAVAIEKAGLVSTEIIEIYENKDLATEYNAFSVPQVFVDDHLVGLGLQPEEVFVEEVITATPIKTRPAETTAEIKDIDLLIIGAGPAGLTAAIYAERSGLATIVAEKANIGGQVAITPIVENYPGFTRIGGKTLMDMMAQQAIQYTDIHEGEEVLDIQRKDNLWEIKTNRTGYTAKAVLLTTGAESKKLDVPGEKEFQGRGVSYCAVCDGYFFKDNKKVLVVGGGNTAATEALFLKNIGVDVTVVHRRDVLRAEKFLQQGLENNHIPVLWNTEVKEIRGSKFIESVVLRDTVDLSEKPMNVDGVFIAIGYTPNNEVATKLGLDLDGEGYIKVDRNYRATIKGIYAAGDITGGMKQIVTAIGQGATAAMTVFEDIANPYWKKQK